MGIAVLLLVVNSLSILGFHFASYDGNALSFFRKVIPDDNVWSKPLYSCPRCMASFHSLYIYPLLWNTMEAGFFFGLFPGYVLALSGLTYLIYEKL